MIFTCLIYGQVFFALTLKVRIVNLRTDAG